MSFFGTKQITYMSSVGLFYRASNPKEIFIEIKDDDHPLKVVRRQLCLIGGNWVGKDARKDVGPLDTFLRKINDELSLEYPIKSKKVMSLSTIHATDDYFFAPAKRNNVEINSEDKEDLEAIKAFIANNVTPCGDYIHSFPASVILAVDPASTKKGFVALTSYFAVAFSDEIWSKIIRLQTKFGNISNQSITLITTLDEIISFNQKTAFSHDRVLKYFFEKQKGKEIKEFPLVDGLTTEYIGETKYSYKDYKAIYNIEKCPHKRDAPFSFE